MRLPVGSSPLSGFAGPAREIQEVRGAQCPRHQREMAAQRLCAAHGGRCRHSPDDLDEGVCGDPGEQAGGQWGVGHWRGGGWRWAQWLAPATPSSTPAPAPPQTNSAPFPCLSVWGYDSDVAREKAVDYTTKICAVSIREMEGTKPHQQMKEVSVEERYGVARFACIYYTWQETRWKQSAFSLHSKLLLKLVFIYVYAQSLNLHTGLSWGKLPTAFNVRRGRVTLCRSCLWKMTWLDMRFS